MKSGESKMKKDENQMVLTWWTVRDSNPGPIGYEPTALPTELTVLSSGIGMPPRK